MNPAREQHPLTTYFAGPHPCAYFPDRTMSAVVVGAPANAQTRVYSELAPLGFRRSGRVLYRPHCQECNACTPLRVPVESFRPNRRFRRVLTRNADLDVTLMDPQDAGAEHFDLYCRYIQARHAHGSMYPPSEDDFLQLTRSFGMDMLTMDVRLGDILVASAVTDVLHQGLAAVYTYFDPALRNRSLGAFAILEQVAECRRRGFDYLYLGYWIEESKNMRYKADYRPAEVLVNGRWSALD